MSAVMGGIHIFTSARHDFGELRTATQKEERNQSSNLIADFRLLACRLQVWYTQLYVQVYCLACPTQAARNYDESELLKIFSCIILLIIGPIPFLGLDLIDPRSSFTN